MLDPLCMCLTSQDTAKVKSSRECESGTYILRLQQTLAVASGRDHCVNLQCTGVRIAVEIRGTCNTVRTPHGIQHACGCTTPAGSIHTLPPAELRESAVRTPRATSLRSSSELDSFPTVQEMLDTADAHKTVLHASAIMPSAVCTLCADLMNIVGQ
jgi:hypothetical protein